MASFLLQLGKEIVISSLTGLYYMGRYLWYGPQPTPEEKIDRILIEMAQLKQLVASTKDAHSKESTEEKSEGSETSKQGTSERKNGSSE